MYMYVFLDLYEPIIWKQAINFLNLQNICYFINIQDQKEKSFQSNFHIGRVNIFMTSTSNLLDNQTRLTKLGSKLSRTDQQTNQNKRVQ